MLRKVSNYLKKHILGKLIFRICLKSFHLHANVVHTILGKYSKVSIIRPGRSRVLEFEKIVCTVCLIETFSKNPDHVV